MECKRCKAKLLQEKYGLYWRKTDKSWYCYDCAMEEKENEKRNESRS